VRLPMAALYSHSISEICEGSLPQHCSGESRFNMGVIVSDQDRRRVPALRRRPRILFVAPQFVPPVYDGSTFVYHHWIEALAEIGDLYAILFSSYDIGPSDAERYLSSRCNAHMILPGLPRSRAWKIVRAVARYATGALFPPRWIDERGRGSVYRRIRTFFASHQPDVVLISKLHSIHLLGEDNIRRSGAIFLLDIHDDFVVRAMAERKVLAGIATRFPAIRRHPIFRDMRLRHLLSRLSEDRARRQERRFLGLVDCVLSSSRQEYDLYRSMLGNTVRCEYQPWPIDLRTSGSPGGMHHKDNPRYGAGFIGGGNPFNVEGIIFFCTQVLPIIRQRRPDFQLLISGTEMELLARVLPRWPGVTFEGFVPDVARFYEQVAVCIVPLLHGTGMSLKTLEALRFGRPVVSTLIGARGLDPEGLSGLVIADEPDEFAARVLELATFPRLARADSDLDSRIGRMASVEAFRRLLHSYQDASPETR
jgi:glycosyltransferase involved in cell wall biosynthesis